MTATGLAAVGFDGAALKPTEVDLSLATALDVGTVTVDYEGPASVPDRETLRQLAGEFDVRLTTPVRARGFDPLAENSSVDPMPEAVSRVLVAGHRAYLSADERRKPIAPRLDAAADAATDPWIGTEGIERLALAIGGTQFELLSGRTGRDVRALRDAGFDGQVALYAPTVLSEDPDEILDAVGDYAVRRKRVRDALPDGADTDSEVTGRARTILQRACREYALVGDPETVSDRIDDLRRQGVDHVVGYPARGLDPVLDGQ